MDNIYISDYDLKRLSKRYNVKYEAYDNNRTIYITSNSNCGKESWIAELYDGEILLKHKNKLRNRTGKNHYHKQRKFNKIEHLFDSINNHKPNYNRTKKTTRMNELFALIN